MKPSFRVFSRDLVHGSRIDLYETPFWRPVNKTIEFARRTSGETIPYSVQCLFRAFFGITTMGRRCQRLCRRHFFCQNFFQNDNCFHQKFNRRGGPTTGRRARALPVKICVVCCYMPWEQINWVLCFILISIRKINLGVPGSREPEYKWGEQTCRFWTNLFIFPRPLDVEGLGQPMERYFNCWNQISVLARFLAN